MKRRIYRMLLLWGANAEQLYDRQRDPYEMRNFARDPASRDVLEQLRRRFEPIAKRWAKVPRASGLRPVTQDRR